MANTYEYKVTVRGKKNACYAFFGSMPVLDCRIVQEEGGTDEDYSLTFLGDCKDSVDAHCTPWKGGIPVELPDDPDEAMRLADNNYWYRTVRDRSAMFGVEVLCNSADTDSDVAEIYMHYICGEDAGGECPDGLRITDTLPEGFCRCIACGGVFPIDDCNQYSEGTYFCHSCFTYTFGV